MNSFGLMKISDNTVLSIVSYFKDELKGLYNKSEIESMLAITFEHYFQLGRIDLVLRKQELLSESDLLKVMHLVKDLKNNKPLAQIIGEWHFFELMFKVNEHTLIPRPETEELVQLIITDSNKLNKMSILDIGTGSGCIAISLSANLKNAKVEAIDISEQALKVSKRNAQLNNAEVSFYKQDILGWNGQKGLKTYDVIVSNPPYISEKEKQFMEKNVLDYEPHLALFVTDKEPLRFYEAITKFALVHLKTKGKLYFEINEKYGREVEVLLLEKNFKNINIVKDINGKDRIVSCNID